MYGNFYANLYRELLRYLNSYTISKLLLGMVYQLELEPFQFLTRTRPGIVPNSEQFQVLVYDMNEIGSYFWIGIAPWSTAAPVSVHDTFQSKKHYLHVLHLNMSKEYFTMSVLTYRFNMTFEDA